MRREALWRRFSLRLHRRPQACVVRPGESASRGPAGPRTNASALYRRCLLAVGIMRVHSAHLRALRAKLLRWPMWVHSTYTHTYEQVAHQHAHDNRNNRCLRHFLRVRIHMHMNRRHGYSDSACLNMSMLISRHPYGIYAFLMAKVVLTTRRFLHNCASESAVAAFAGPCMFTPLRLRKFTGISALLVNEAEGQLSIQVGNPP